MRLAPVFEQIFEKEAPNLTLILFVTIVAVNFLLRHVSSACLLKSHEMSLDYDLFYMLDLLIEMQNVL